MDIGKFGRANIVPYANVSQTQSGWKKRTQRSKLLDISKKFFFFNLNTCFCGSLKTIVCEVRQSLESSSQ